MAFVFVDLENAICDVRSLRSGPAYDAAASPNPCTCVMIKRSGPAFDATANDCVVLFSICGCTFAHVPPRSETQAQSQCISILMIMLSAISLGLGDPWRRLRKGASPGRSALSVLSFLNLKSCGGCSPRRPQGICDVWVASIRVPGSTPPACGLWPHTSRMLCESSYGFRPVEVVRSGCWRLFPMGGTSHQNLAPRHTRTYGWKRKGVRW